MQSLELPKISKNGNAFGPLKFNNRLDSANVKILTHLQNDNVFFRKKLAEFENRLDNISSGPLFLHSYLGLLKKELNFLTFVNYIS